MGLIPAAMAALLLAAPAGAERPEILYKLHCQGCHGPEGAGLAGSVPDLRGSLALFLSVPGGREFLVQVPGSALSPLSDADLAAVLDWMLRRFGPEEVARRYPPYRAEEVRRYREAPLSEVEAVRERLLERIAAARR